MSEKGPIGGHVDESRFRIPWKGLPRLLAAVLLSLLGAPALRAQEPGAEPRSRSPERPPVTYDPGTPPKDAATELVEALGRLHFSGNADLEFLYGQSNSLAPGGRFIIDNTRIYLDADLSRELTLGSSILAQDSSFYIEGDIAREGRLTATVGSLYFRLDGLAGIRELNLKFGRFLVPFGEEYIRQSEGRPDNPLLDFSVAIPYGWDEGILLFGRLFEDRVDYFLAATNGDAYFNQSSGAGVAIEGRLEVHPAPWLELAVSGLHVGRLGNSSRPGQSALEWSGENLKPLGSGTAVPVFQEGAVVPPDPDGRLRDLGAWEADLVFSAEGWGRLWLGYGGVRVHSGGNSLYDRSLRYGIIEGIFEMGALSGDLERFYAAARWSVIGTFDGGRGYLLGDLDGGDTLGFNAERLQGASVGVGFRVSPNVIVKVEYSWFDFDLVRGVTPDLRAGASHRNYGGLGVSLHF